MQINGSFDSKIMANTEYSFFNSREEAGIFVGKSKSEVVVRNANLEDVFISLTGRKVSE